MVNFQLYRHHLCRDGIRHQRNYRVDNTFLDRQRNQEVT